MRLRKALADALTPPPEITLSEWSEANMVLSADYAASVGKFHSIAYQKGMMDAMADPRNKSVCVMKSARTGYTQAINCAVAYFIQHDPSPILMVQPRNSDAEDHSKRMIAPMLRDVPVLMEIAGTSKSRTSSNTILVKSFTNGSSLKLIGADSPGGFRRVTVRVVLFDEIDGYPAGAGSEGDQIALGTKRTETYWNRIVIMGSTPTIDGESRIQKEWEKSDQRRFFVECPHCHEKQYLKWGGNDKPFGIKWKKDHNGEYIEDSAYYVCELNGCIIEENEKFSMIESGEWIATKPFRGYAGFHIWSGYSPFPNASWSRLVEEWIKVHKDPLQRQTFVNLVLGEPYEDKGDHALAESKLLERCEIWASDVPRGVGVITAGVDFQHDRAEIEVVGWGRYEESWSIAYEIIEGAIDDPEFWAKIDKYLSKVFVREDGRGFTIAAAALDTGGQEGHTQKAYDFCKARLGRKIWGIKGEAARGGQRSPVWPTKKPTSRTKATYRPTIIGINTAKDILRNRLHISAPGAGYMHFPSSRDLVYFQQLISERSVRKEMRGQSFRIWELPPGTTNEALDCRVYAYAALCGLQHHGLRLNDAVEWAETGSFEKVEEVEIINTQGEKTVEYAKPKPKMSMAERLASMNR